MNKVAAFEQGFVDELSKLSEANTPEQEQADFRRIVRRHGQKGEDGETTVPKKYQKRHDRNQRISRFIDKRVDSHFKASVPRSVASMAGHGVGGAALGALPGFVLKGGPDTHLMTLGATVGGIMGARHGAKRSLKAQLHDHQRRQRIKQYAKEDAEKRAEVGVAQEMYRDAKGVAQKAKRGISRVSDAFSGRDPADKNDPIMKNFKGKRFPAAMKAGVSAAGGRWAGRWAGGKALGDRGRTIGGHIGGVAGFGAGWNSSMDKQRMKFRHKAIKRLRKEEKRQAKEAKS